MMVIAHQRKPHFYDERSDPKIVRRDGGSSRFQKKPQIRVNPGEDGINADNFRKSKVLAKPGFIALPVARLSDTELIFTQNDHGDDQPGGRRERGSAGWEAIRPC